MNLSIITLSRMLTAAKDSELLEYRDEQGLLLTRKEAYRNLCYQSHGYGSGKKNQERRLKQIQREKLEKTSTSDNQSAFATSKATPKATGKFVDFKQS